MAAVDSEGSRDRRCSEEAAGPWLWPTALAKEAQASLGVRPVLPAGMKWILQQLQKLKKEKLLHFKIAFAVKVLAPAGSACITVRLGGPSVRHVHTVGFAGRGTRRPPTRGGDVDDVTVATGAAAPAGIQGDDCEIP